jgi:rapamycin-insensitive companion of mTOR
MLKYSFSDSDRLGEALDTKWVRRVSGFYRCTADEKGYFANMEWDPANLFFLECASDLYSVLVSYDNGVAFLGSDRRGMLFNEMAGELEQLVSNDKGWVGSGGLKNMFRLVSVSQFMVREFFSLVGRMCASKPGRRLLDSTSVFNHLSCLGTYKQLDYLSRVVITGLAFTDRGFLSQNLIQIWTSSDNCSQSLRAYIHSLMLALLRSHPEEFLRWGVNVVSNQLLLEEFPSVPLMQVIEEAAQDPTALRAMIQRRPNIAILPNDSCVPVRMLSCVEGIDFLNNKDLLRPMLDSWEEKIVEYPLRLERAFASALCREFPGSLQAIAIPSVETCGMQISDCGKSSDSGVSNSVLAGETVDLEGMLRIPWGIEVKLTSSQSYSSHSNSEYLRMDTYLGMWLLFNNFICLTDRCADVSEMSTPASCDFIGERDRRVIVKGVVLDGRGLPTAHPIAANKVTQCCLLAGVCSVNRKGIIGTSYSTADGRQQRRKSTATSSSTPTSAHSSHGGRESLTARSRPSITAEVTLDDIPPVSCQSEQSFDWSLCKPNQRQSNVIKLKDGKFAVEVPGEPVRWIFSRSVPGSLYSAVIEEHNDGSNRVDATRTGGFVYLVEVQYHIRLETGLVIIFSFGF